ncbi:flagellar hook assembly protein FlgD [Kordiimonas aquimaris]|uniref:flagellar hook assembly protein FlgD n=1 Tax=Kordiimonas aquimaris TaxID=707591 RepID=UPI0021CE65DD|nr:flagellar hook capping FlgD N-terminal domain-containing protein [Kordiimonas aquimaris]
MIDLFNVTSAANTGQTAATGSAAALAEDFDDFLTLLTTQLQNQDPLDPLDSNEFTQQLVSFSGVEQQIQTNQNLENLAGLISNDNLATAANYLGTDALIANTRGDHDGQSGIQWQYQNRLDTDDLTLNVLNEAGSLIYSETGDASFGLHEFNWTGVDAAGNPVEPGTYELQIAATNEDGNTVEPAIAVVETITSIDTVSGVPRFNVGPNQVTQSELLQLIYGE